VIMGVVVSVCMIVMIVPVIMVIMGVVVTMVEVRVGVLLRLHQLLEAHLLVGRLGLLEMWSTTLSSKTARAADQGRWVLLVELVDQLSCPDSGACRSAPGAARPGPPELWPCRSRR
jgi:hypothetical protein